MAPGPTADFIRLFNRGAACGLAGWPVVSGATADGRWEVVPVRHVTMLRTNGPTWTGVFDRSLTAVTGVSPSPEPCGLKGPTRHYGAMQLGLPTAGGGTIDLPGVAFDSGPCPLDLTPFEADSQDA